MFVQLICKDRNEKEKNEIYEVLGLLCQREGIQIEDKEDSVDIYVCPQGTIHVVEEDDAFILSANTRFAGPGFHAFVVEFFMDVMEELSAEAKQELNRYELKDDLNYDGSFEQLYEVYEDEIQYLKDVILKNKDVRTQNYMYEQTYFVPMLKENQIATAIGLLDVEEFEKLSPSQLMDHFYVWNNWDKDARFFKNAALLLLAKESFDQYSNMSDVTYRNANAICDYIELAHQEDNALRLPLKEYKALCEYIQRTPKDMNCKQMEEEVFQYRVKEVFHLFENARIVSSGLAQRSYDSISQSLCLMSPYLDDVSWDWLVQASLKDGICTNLEELLRTEPIHYNHKKIWMKDWNMDTYSIVEAIVQEKDAYLYFHCTISNAKDIPYICQCIKESEFQKGMAM